MTRRTPSPPPPSRGDPWPALRRLTPARVGLGRTGAALPTARHLDFQLAHALARDAVHSTLETDRLADELKEAGFEPVRLHSAAPDRATYLRRPDLGRRLDEASRDRLAPYRGDRPDLAFVIADGLSATAVNRHAVPLAAATAELVRPLGWRIGPVALVEQGRVAIGDEIGALLSGQLVAVLIGERPGLSAADSLGVYATWAPAPGVTVDAERNCLSNVRPDGFPIAAAARELCRLLVAAKAIGATGIPLSRHLAAAGSPLPVTPEPLPGGAVGDAAADADHSAAADDGDDGR
ncbi:MAG TPA: ethanolamine ammonia-lyase subunit EutC [Stellaceae bacterium]